MPCGIRTAPRDPEKEKAARCKKASRLEASNCLATGLSFHQDANVREKETRLDSMSKVAACRGVGAGLPLCRGLWEGKRSPPCSWREDVGWHRLVRADGKGLLSDLPAVLDLWGYAASKYKDDTLKQMLQRPTTAALYFQISPLFLEVFLQGEHISPLVQAVQDKKEEENNKSKMLFGSPERNSFHERLLGTMLPTALFQVYLRKGEQCHW